MTTFTDHRTAYVDTTGGRLRTVEDIIPIDREDLNGAACFMQAVLSKYEWDVCTCPPGRPVCTHITPGEVSTDFAPVAEALAALLRHMANHAPDFVLPRRVPTPLSLVETLIATISGHLAACYSLVGSVMDPGRFAGIGADLALAQRLAAQVHAYDVRTYAIPGDGEDGGEAAAGNGDTPSGPERGGPSWAGRGRIGAVAAR